jgi:hypothetical protein
MYLSARVSGTQSVDFSYLGTIIDALPLLLAGPLVEHDAGQWKQNCRKPIVLADM